MTTAEGAWSLNINWVPYLRFCPTSVSECPKKIQIIHGSQVRKSLLYHSLVLSGLNKNPAVQKTSPGRLESAFPNIPARFTSPTFCSGF